MAECSARPTGQNCRHPPRIHAQKAVTYRIDTPVNSVKDASLQPSLDRSRTKPDAQQLTPRNHSVLPFGELGRLPIEPTRAPFTPPGVVNGAHVFHEDGAWLKQARGWRAECQISRTGPSLVAKKRLQPDGTAPGFDPLKKRVGASSGSHRTKRDRPPRRLCWVKR